LVFLPLLTFLGSQLDRGGKNFDGAYCAILDERDLFLR